MFFFIYVVPIKEQVPVCDIDRGIDFNVPQVIIESVDSISRDGPDCPYM